MSSFVTSHYRVPHPILCPSESFLFFPIGFRFLKEKVSLTLLSFYLNTDFKFFILPENPITLLKNRYYTLSELHY